MMVSSSTNAVAVIGPQYCVAHPLDLHIIRKLMHLSEGNFDITDQNGNIIFTVKSTLWSIHDRRRLLDSTGKTILTYQMKMMSIHRRWVAFRGDSTDDKDILFSVKKSGLLQARTKLDVFMANNKNQDVCDYRIQGNWWESSCVIYAGQSDTIVAQMHKKHSASSILLGKDNFVVTVYPNVDYAFIAGLITILAEINTDRSQS